MDERKLILFQGDSITDAGRGKEAEFDMGFGYPAMVAGRLGVDAPTAYRTMNLGISGNRVVDLYARWKIDCLNHKPAIVSILIGINDVWHELGNGNGIEADKFEFVYGILVEETLRKLPGVKFMILEPFVTDGTATRANADYFYAETKLRAEAAKRVAEKYALTFVPLQSVFDEAMKKAPAEHWTLDGVHPMPAGHQLIADAWLSAFKTL